jgi:hypothetical protein
MMPARVGYRRMWPQQGCYGERYRLTGSAALGLAASLLSIGLGLLWHTPVVFAVTAVILAAVAAQGGITFGMASPPMAQESRGRSPRPGSAQPPALGGTKT